MRHTIIVAICIFALVPILGAQSPFNVAELETELEGNLGSLDDIVVMPDGTIIIATPHNDVINVLRPNLTPPLTPLPLPPVVCSAMALAPDGTIVFGENMTDSIMRYDLENDVLTTLATGFNIPIDVVFDQNGDLWVVDQTNGDFFFGENKVYKLELDANGNVESQTLVVSGITGAADIVLDGNIMYVTSLGQPIVGAIDLTTGALWVVATEVYLPTDIVLQDDGTLLVSTIYESKLLLIDPPTFGKRVLASHLGSAGTGAEDIDYAANGDILVSLKTGEVVTINMTTELRQVGASQVGTSFELVFDMPQFAGRQYAMMASVTANVGQMIGNDILPLDNDALFAVSTARPQEFVNFDGHIDGFGHATARVDLPPYVWLVGLDLYFAALVFDDITQPAWDWDVTNAVKAHISD